MKVIKQKMTRKVNITHRHKISNMSRREFKEYLYDLYGCHEAGISNDVVAESTYQGDDFSHLEIFNSPDGVLIAVHHGPASSTVDLIRSMPVRADAKAKECA